MSHSNEFWNFGNADRSEDTPKGYFTPLFPHNLGRPLHHPEQDYNAHLIGQIVKGFRVIGSGTDGEMTTADLELGIKLHEVNPGDGTPGSADADYAHYIEAGAKDYEWIWVPAEMGGITTSPLSVSGSAVDKNDCQNQLATINAVASGGTPQYEFSLQASSGLSFGNISNWSTSNVFTQFNGSNLIPGNTYYIYCKDIVGGNIISSGITPTEIIAHTTSIVVDNNITQPGGDDGQVTVSITGGTGPFDYNLYKGSDPNNISSAVLIESSNGTLLTSVTFPTNASGSTVSLNAGSYFAIVTDSTSLCQISDGPVNLTEPQQLTVATVPLNADCAGGDHLLMIAPVAGGTQPYQYSITDPNTDGYTWVNGNSFNIPSGNTMVYPAVKDDSGFIVDGPIHTYQDPASYSFALSANDSDCSNQNGSIVFSALQGGPSPTIPSFELPAQWEFSVDGGNTFSSTWTETNPGDQYTYSGLSAGSYDCVIRRVSSLGTPTCSSPFQNIAVAQAPNITANITSTDDIICGNNGSGTIDISGVLSGGQNVNLDYTLTWSLGGNQLGSEILSVDNYSIGSLDSGTYLLNLTNNDAAACSFTQIVVIADATSNIQLIIDDSSDPSCNGATDGYVDLSVTNGTAPYTYSYNTGGNDIVLEAGSPNDTWSEIGSFGADDYEFTVVDANGCSDSISITLTDPSAVTATITKDADAGCFGESNGQLTANGSGGTGQYTYVWSNGETTQTISNLIAGNYDVVVTDTNGCTAAQVSEDINQYNNTTVVLDSQTNVSCNGGNNGSAQITASGDGPFTYSWIDTGNNNVVSTDQNPTGLTAGEYNVFVTNVSGSCNVSASSQGWTLVITEPTAIQVNVTTVNETVSGQNDGSVTIDVSGGTLQYDVQYADSNSNGVLINGSAGQTQFIFEDLAPGSYTILGADGNSCPISGSFTIAPGTGTVTIDSTSQSVINCNGGDGTFTMTVSGGSGNYAFSDDNNIWISSTSPYTFPGPYQGGTTHTFYVEDADTQDTDSIEYTFAHPAIISAGVSTTAESIQGANDGEISISNITGGSGTYTLAQLTDSNGNFVSAIASPSAAGPHVFDNLAADTYTIQIVDDNSCDGFVSGTVADGSAGLSITTSSGTITCNGGNTDVTVNVTGGSGTYRFSSDDGATYTGFLTVNSYTFNLAAGTYTIKVEDQQTYPNNMVSDSVTLSEPTLVTNTANITNESIQGQNDGQIEITVSGGTPNYRIQLIDVATSNPVGSEVTNIVSSHTFTNLAPGDYLAHIYDSNDCYTSTDPTIAAGGAQINIVSLIAGPISCNGGSGVVTMTVAGGSGDYSYSTNPSGTPTYNGAYDPVTQSTTNTWNAVAGQKYFFVKDTVTGQIASSFVTLTQPNAIDASLNGAETYPGADDASIQIFITGGTAPYSVTCNETSETLTNLPEANGGIPSGTFTTITSAGTYTFDISDDNGCQKSFTGQIVTQFTNINIDSITAYTTCYGESNGSISVSASGGSGNYQWSNDGGVNWSQNINSFDNLAGGAYLLYLQDMATGESVEYGDNPVLVQEGLEINVIQSIMTGGTCSAYPEYYIKFSGSNLTNDIVANQSVTLEWSLGNSGGANNTTADITNITSLGNNEFEGSISFDSLTTVNNSGTFNVRITSDGCEKIHGQISYTTFTPPVLSVILISEPECPGDGWVYEFTASGGPSTSYNLTTSPNNGPNLINGWDGSAQNVNIAESLNNNTAIMVQHTDYSNNGCQSNVVIVDSRTVNQINISGSIYVPTCHGNNDNSTMSFTITGGLDSGNTIKYKLSDDGGSTFGSEQTYTSAVNNMVIGNGTHVIKAWRIVNGNSTESSCSAQETIGTVVNPNPISGSVMNTTQPTQCQSPGNVGSITMTINGGNGNYEFSKDGGVNYETLIPDGNGNYTFDNLTAGTWTVIGRDTAGCEAFDEQRTLTLPNTPVWDYTDFFGCWRDSDNPHVEMEVFMVDIATQGAGGFTFTEPFADNSPNTDGKFIYSGSDMSYHVPRSVTVTDNATLCSVTVSANQHGFNAIPPVISTGGIANLDNSPSQGDVNDFYVNNISGGTGYPYTVELLDSNGVVVHQSTLLAGQGTAITPYEVQNSGDYTYRIYDSTFSGTGCGRTYTTPMTATIAQTNEETFYHLHTGSGNVYPFADLMTNNAAYLIGDSTYTTYMLGNPADFDIVMTNLIDLGDGTNSSPDVGSFEFAGPITGNNCGQTWTHNASSGSNYYYLAVPNNSLFTENLVSDGVFQFQCNGLTSYANDRKAFTYGGENYWLYKLTSGSGTAANQYGFK